MHFIFRVEVFWIGNFRNKQSSSVWDTVGMEHQSYTNWMDGVSGEDLHNKIVTSVLNRTQDYKWNVVNVKEKYSYVCEPLGTGTEISVTIVTIIVTHHIMY